jgi:hypothetical protein
MNEELQKQLAEMLAALMRVAQDGSAWAQGQIPMLVQEKILYGRVSMTAWMLLYLAGVVAACVAWPRARRAQAAASADYHQTMNDTKYRFDSGVADRQIFTVIALLALCVGGGICALAALDAIDSLVQVWFAPRLYIIDWLRTFR